MSEFVPPGHVCLVIRELARGVLDLSATENSRDREQPRSTRLPALPPGDARGGDELPPHALHTIRKLEQMRASMQRIERAAQEKAERIAADRAAPAPSGFDRLRRAL